MKKKICTCIAIAILFTHAALANIYYVSTTGNDISGDGSSSNPWRTLRHAITKVPANQGHTIQIAAGTFVEAGRVDIPPGVNIQGAGKNLTIIKAAASFYYNPASPGYATDRFLISLQASSPISGNQSVRDFSVDGDSKQLHGGICVRNRNNVLIERVSVRNTNFTGIWLWDVKDSRLTDSDLTNCSWGSSGYCAGALNLGNLERVEIDRLRIDESVGYGIKAIGPGYNTIVGLKIRDSHISVNPFGLWNNGQAPNIAIELFISKMIGSEIYNSYVDNNISIVTNSTDPATGVQAIRIHHNTIDMETRANGGGYGVELTVHDAEIDHNYFIKGSYGIANWHAGKSNWSIHHNVFYALGGLYPGEMLRSQTSGLSNVDFYNNTIEFAGSKTMNVVGLYGGTSQNVKLFNNLFINNNTGYSYYPNSLIHLENGAVLNNLTVKNNLFDRLPVGSVAGTYSGNLTGDPKIARSGARPSPYYVPAATSPLIDAGLNLLSGLLDPIFGSNPDIGAYEYTTGVSNQSPKVSITGPANNATFDAGSTIVITANASDIDGTISKVEFYNGSAKLGEDVASPHNFSWSNVPTGSYTLTARATDNSGAIVTSAPVSVNVTVPSAPLPSPWSNGDIGGVGAAGSASYANGNFNLKGSGLDIWDYSDEFHFVYQRLTGNGSIVAKVNSLTNTHEWAKAGVMIRESMNANSTHAMTVITASNGVSFQRRLATGNISYHTTLAGHTAPKWVKIERQANTFTSSYSSDGITWTVIGTGVINMGPNAYIGLCITSHSDGAVAAASISDVTVTGPLPLPWMNSDIGTPRAAGGASYADGSFIVRGSGEDIWHAADAFQFVYQPMSGDGSIIAKVDALAVTHGWAKAGVMIRESLRADAKHATSVITPWYGVSFQRRMVTGGISYHTTLSGYTAPVWVKIERSGNTFVSSYSTDRVNWTVIGSNVIAMSTDVYVGLCVTSHADGIVTTASLSDVSISSSGKGDTSVARTTKSDTALVPDEEAAQRMDVFPNPVSDGLLTISYSSATAQSAEITVKSVTSLTTKQLMLSLRPGLNSVQMDMQDEPAGMYVVSIVTSDGRRSLRKIMVTK